MEVYLITAYSGGAEWTGGEDYRLLAAFEDQSEAKVLVEFIRMAQSKREPFPFLNEYGFDDPDNVEMLSEHYTYTNNGKSITEHKFWEYTFHVDPMKVQPRSP